MDLLTTFCHVNYRSLHTCLYNEIPAYLLIDILGLWQTDSIQKEGSRVLLSLSEGEDSIRSITCHPERGPFERELR